MKHARLGVQLGIVQLLWKRTPASQMAETTGVDAIGAGVFSDQPKLAHWSMPTSSKATKRMLGGSVPAPSGLPTASAEGCAAAITPLVSALAKASVRAGFILNPDEETPFGMTSNLPRSRSCANGVPRY